MKRKKTTLKSALEVFPEVSSHIKEEKKNYYYNYNNNRNLFKK